MDDYTNSFSMSAVDHLLDSFPWLAPEVSTTGSAVAAGPPSPALSSVSDLWDFQQPWSPTALVDGTQQDTVDDLTATFLPSETLVTSDYELPVSPCSISSTSSVQMSTLSPHPAYSSPETSIDGGASSGYRSQSSSSWSDLDQSLQSPPAARIPPVLDFSQSTCSFRTDFSQSACNPRASPVADLSPVHQTSYQMLTEAVQPTKVPLPTARGSQRSHERKTNVKKPTTTYIEMIARALLQSLKGRLILSDIYDYVLDNYPYYQTAQSTWRNAVRHNLSVNECFMKAGRADNGRGFYWAIHPACIDMFKKGDFRRMQARRLAQRMYNSFKSHDKTTPTTDSRNSTPTTSATSTTGGIPSNYQGPTRTVTPVYGTTAYNSSATYYSATYRPQQQFYQYSCPQTAGVYIPQHQ